MPTARRSLAVAAASLAGALLAQAAPGLERTQVAAGPAPTAAVSEHRIGVRGGADGYAEFYDRTTGETFAPHGHSYVRLADQTGPGGAAIYGHSTFDIGLYDAPRSEAALGGMAAHGYNVVRVFLNSLGTQGIGDARGGLSAAYLDNVIDFLRRARSHGVYVVLSADYPPVQGGYTIEGDCAAFDYWNLYNLCAGGVTSIARYVHDVAQALVDKGAPLDALLGYQIRTEYYYDSDRKPLSWTSGLVTAADGGSYDMASPTSRQQMMDNGLVYFTDTVKAAIVSVDPMALVTVGFFWPQGPNPSRIGDARVIEPYPAILRSTADYVDIHAYALAGDLTIGQMIENFKIEGQKQKPVMMGEFGAFKYQYPSISTAATLLRDWRSGACAHHLKGWMLWTWDTEEPEQVPPLWAARSGDGSIDDGLAPSLGADPCAERSTPVATSFYTVTPCRVLDTRGPTGALGGPALQPSATRIFVVAGTCGLPAAARSVSVNVTVTNPATPGHLILFPGIGSAPLASTINFVPGRTRANNAVVALASDGSGSIAVKNGSAGTVDLVLDVNGYFQ